MATLNREIEVSKELVELGEGIANFLKTVKGALDDGFQPGDDVSEIIGSLLRDLIPALQGVEDIDDELKENPQAFANAIYVGFSPIAFLFLSEDEPA